MLFCIQLRSVSGTHPPPRGLCPMKIDERRSAARAHIVILSPLSVPSAVYSVHPWSLFPAFHQTMGDRFHNYHYHYVVSTVPCVFASPVSARLSSRRLVVSRFCVARFDTCTSFTFNICRRRLYGTLLLMIISP